MMNNRLLMTAWTVAVAVLVWTAPVPADESTIEADLPEAVTELVNALSGVESVEALEDDRYAIHRRVEKTGSRVKRDVTMTVTEDGTVVDWGRDADFLRSYTLSELRTTGYADLARALADLDPAIQTRGGG
jgi:hypothetical protein